MRKDILILMPFIAVAVFLSRPEALPAKHVEATPIQTAEVEPVSLSFLPKSVEQGEPVLVTIENLGTSTVKSLVWDGKVLKTFENAGQIQALIGLDLRLTPKTYPVELTLNDGQVIKKDLIVKKRDIVSAPLGIPESLGGNTTTSEQALLKTLADEGAIINAIPSGNTKLWNGNFRLPIDPPITITDVYGYSRETGASTLAHKGTDFRASVGTSVYAINTGKVAYVGYLRNYGNVVVLDHGLGLLSIYMHLSQVLVKVGESVEKSALIARSGETGYVLGPHLHLTVRVGGISIDPMRFLKLLGEN